MGECRSGDHTCHTNAMCTDSGASYDCECIVGYELAGDGTTCDSKIFSKNDKSVIS